MLINAKQHEDLILESILPFIEPMKTFTKIKRYFDSFNQNKLILYSVSFHQTIYDIQNSQTAYFNAVTEEDTLVEGMCYKYKRDLNNPKPRVCRVCGCKITNRFRLSKTDPKSLMGYNVCACNRFSQ